MNKKHVSKVGKYISMACLLFVCATVQSCRDEYYYDDREPDFLGASIYDYLKEQGNFELFLRVIDDLNYGDVLRKTGSKTLFVADDAAFKQGIKDEWNLTSYEQLTAAHKKIILYGAMLDNAYLLEMLSKMQSTGANAEPVSGKCLRRETSASVVDTIGLFTYKDLPKGNPDWDIFNPESEDFRAGSVRLALDATQPMMTHFIQDYLYQNGITENDLRILVGDDAASWTDMYIFDKKVLRDKSDVTCKNGYVHQLDGLLIPPSNMAEELRLNADKTMLESGELDCDILANSETTTMLFSRMLDRYAVPVPIIAKNAVGEEMKIAETFNYNKDVVEQLYQKRYYTEGSSRGAKKEKGFTTYIDVLKQSHGALGSLLFDPGWNALKGTSEQKAKEVDMAAIFAPSDKAVVSFFREDESGRSMIARYGANVPDPFGKGLLQAMDSIPVDKLQPLVRNHMQMSFISAVPSKFSLVVNDARDPMHVKEEDVNHTMLANNGVVYVMNKLYSPARYESVVAPVMFDDTLAIFNKLIDDLDYDTYLLSMQNKFTLVATSDSSMVYYSPKTDVDGKDPHEAYRFEGTVNAEGVLAVQAKVYRYNNGTYDVTTNTYKLDKKPTGDPKPLAKDQSNLVKEILEYNIVLGDVNSEEDCASGKKYYMAKGYGTVMVQRGESGFGKVTAIAGGRERQNGAWIPVSENNAKQMENGHMIKLNTSMIQPPVQSVYDVLSTTPEYERFFNLCQPAEGVLDMILPKDATTKDRDKYYVFDRVSKRVRMFDTYHYTVYVPDSVSLDYAFEHEGLPSWESLSAECEQIKKENDPVRKAEMMDSLKAGVELLVKFVRYHFQDNSVYADMSKHVLEVEGQAPEYTVNYETSALNDSTNRFCSVSVQTVERNGKNTIAVRGDFGEKNGEIDESRDANVCHVVNADPMQENKLYNVMARDIEFGNGTNWKTWDINTSSYAVIHQIDGCLKFGGKGGIYDSEKKQFIR